MHNGHDVRTDSARPLSAAGMHRDLSTNEVVQLDPSLAADPTLRPPEAARAELMRRLESLRAGLDTLNREHFESDSNPPSCMASLPEC